VTFDVLSTAAETASGKSATIRFVWSGANHRGFGFGVHAVCPADLMAGLPSPNLIFEKTESTSP